MPWHIGKPASCPASKPYGVIRDADGHVEGCHPTQSSARAQMAALYANDSLRAKDFDPHEPRDEQGRWTSTGVGGIGTPNDVLGDRSMGSVIGPVPRGRGEKSPFTNADRKALQHYCGTEESMAINKRLRDHEAPDAVIKSLDRAMQHAGPIGKPIRAYRMAEEAQHEGLEPGKAFTDLGFGSATANGDRGDWIERTMTRFTLSIHPDVKAIWGANPTEQELVLERGCRYVIRSVTQEGNRWQIQADVLPPT